LRQINKLGLVFQALQTLAVEAAAETKKTVETVVLVL
jgi:hypothetical protein